MSHKILVLNPGSTSTKAAVYEDEHPLMLKSIGHTNQDLSPYPALNDQLDYRVALVRSWLAQEGFDLTQLSAVVGRGGIIPNIVAGGYVVDDNLTDCLLHHTVFDHASNLGGLMAREFAEPLRIPAYIYDAVTSDELPPEARVTGFKEVTRTSFCHVLHAGGLANSKKLTSMVIDYLHNLCRVVVIPGENEMEALALGALRILNGQEQVHTFCPVCPMPIQ